MTVDCPCGRRPGINNRWCTNCGRPISQQHPRPAPAARFDTISDPPLAGTSRSRSAPSSPRAAVHGGDSPTQPLGLSRESTTKNPLWVFLPVTIVAVLVMTGAVVLGKVMHTSPATPVNAVAPTSMPTSVGQVARLNVGASATQAIAVSRDGSTVFVGVYDEAGPTKTSGPSTLVTLDAHTGQRRASIPMDSGVLGVVASPDGRRVYASASNAGVVDVVDLDARTVIARISTGNFPEGLAMSPDGRTLWVAQYGDGTVVGVDTATNTVRTTTGGVAHAAYLATSPDGGSLFVGRDGGATILDTGDMTKTEIDLGPSDETPMDVTVNSDGTRGYVALSDSSSHGGELASVNLVSRTVVQTVEVPTLPSALASTGQSLYAAHSALGSDGTGTVASVSPETGAMSSPITIGYNPSSMVATPDGRMLLAVDGDDTVSAVRIK